MNRVIEPILNVAVQRWNKAIPQAALREDEETDAVNLMHHLNDTGKKSLRHAMAIVITASKQQILELIEGDDYRDFLVEKNNHQHFEKGGHQILPRGTHLKLQLCE